MKKLAFVRYKQTSFGGAENYLSRLAKALDEKKTEYEIISTSDFGEKKSSVKIPSFFPSFIKIALFSSFVSSIKRKKNLLLFSLERIAHPDIYRAGDGVHREWLEIKEKESGGVFAKLANFLNPKNHVYKYLEKRCFENSAKIIANSYLVKSNILKHFEIDAEKIEVVYNGLPAYTLQEQSLSDSEKFKTELGIKEDEIVFLYVGSGFFRKGVKYLIEILSRLEEKNFKALIVGKEKNLKHYQNLAEKVGLEEKIVFTGTRKDVERFYSISDIFLFPTLYEPFSNATLEAMAYGNVIITTRDNGVSEILDNKELIMDSARDMKIVKKIEHLMKNREKRKNIGKLNSIKAKEFTIERNLDESLKIIEGLL